MFLKAVFCYINIKNVTYLIHPFYRVPSYHQDVVHFQVQDPSHQDLEVSLMKEVLDFVEEEVQVLSWVLVLYINLFITIVFSNINLK